MSDRGESYSIYNAWHAPIRRPQNLTPVHISAAAAQGPSMTRDASLAYKRRESARLCQTKRITHAGPGASSTVPGGGGAGNHPYAEKSARVVHHSPDQHAPRRPLHPMPRAGAAPHPSRVPKRRSCPWTISCAATAWRSATISARQRQPSFSDGNKGERMEMR